MYEKPLLGKLIKKLTSGDFLAFFFQISIVVLCIVLGTKKGPIHLGLFASMALVVFGLALGLPVPQPPVNVLLIILAMIVATSTVEACGGLDYLVYVASCKIERNPKHIHYFAPLISYLITFSVGTGHVIYSLLPVIVKVSKNQKIKPETPLSMSVIASQQAITSSPLSAATVLLFSLTHSRGLSFTDILMVCIPSTVLGILTMCTLTPYLRRNSNLPQQDLLPAKEAPSAQSFDHKKYPYAKRSVLLFIFGVITVVLLNILIGNKDHFSWLKVNASPTSLMQALMLSLAGVIVIACKVEAPKIVRQNVFLTGIQALIAILGMAWLGDCFFQANKHLLSQTSLGFITQNPALFCGICFISSALLYSQSVTVQTLFPVALHIRTINCA